MRMSLRGMERRYRDRMEVFIGAGVAIASFMLVLWLISLVIDDVSIVDIGWGAGFVVVAWVTATIAGSWSSSTIIMVAATTIWGLRLAGYLAWRNLGHGEDPRYARMRTGRGAAFRWQSLYIVFGLQGALMWLISLPQQATATAGAATALSWVGAAIVVVGIVWESTADIQLARFKADPANKGQVLDRGVWRWSRHPNYFGDSVAWWGLFVIAVSVGGWWTVVSPAVMTFLLLRVSGVTLLESGLSRSKSGYAEYVETTNAFIPGPKRR